MEHETKSNVILHYCVECAQLHETRERLVKGVADDVYAQLGQIQQPLLALEDRAANARPRDVAVPDSGTVAEEGVNEWMAKLEEARMLKLRRWADGKVVIRRWVTQNRGHDAADALRAEETAVAQPLGETVPRKFMHSEIYDRLQGVLHARQKEWMHKWHKTPTAIEDLIKKLDTVEDVRELEAYSGNDADQCAERDMVILWLLYENDFHAELMGARLYKRTELGIDAEKSNINHRKRVRTGFFLASELIADRPYAMRAEPKKRRPVDLRIMGAA